MFVSFRVFFPETSYNTKWEDAYGVLRARDMILVLERTDNLHRYAFNRTEMDSFLDTISSGTNLIFWNSVTGGIKGNFRIACNCSDQTVSDLNSWYDDMTLNNREINVTFCHSYITSTDSCLQNSDMLLIMGEYSDLSGNEKIINDYISEGNGIVQSVDFYEETQIESDNVQKNIFNLEWNGIEIESLDYVSFEREPRNNEDIIYTIHKYFYHLPLPKKSTETDIITGCTEKGYIEINSNEYSFWICNNNTVIFDTDDDNIADTEVSEEEFFVLGDENFYLNYIHGNSRISFSFRPDYEFDDFLSFVYPGEDVLRIVNVTPRDQNSDKVLLLGSSSSGDFPACIINEVHGGKSAWIPLLGKDGYTDDEKTLLLSLILWSSNKESNRIDLSQIRSGYKSSYIKVVNRDMFEIYKFNFGIGYPF